MSGSTVEPRVFDYWYKRAEAVVARLNKHGLPASCGTMLAPAGEGRTVKTMKLDLTDIGQVVLAEAVLERLDRERSEQQKGIAQLKLQQGNDAGEA